ncbi:MAG TPA: DUF5719 family protein [Nocardioides sp.]|nr:DUF5719 family protein [Nocardioides sp.]
MTEPTPGKRAGRRVAERPERTRRDLGALVPVALLLVAALAIALTRGTEPEDVIGGTDGALVDRAQLACPTSDLPDLTGAGVRATASAGLLATDEAGQELGTSGDLGSGLPGDEPRTLDVGRGELVPLEDAADGPSLDASGELAAGLFGFRTDRRGGATPASAVGACVAPRASWWFTGVGADLDHTSELVLTNLDPGPAVVDVIVYGPEGAVDTIGTRGITVAPGETTTIPLADVAPQSPELMVNVEASRGRVAVAASDRFAVRPAAPVGFSWVGDANRPSRRVRLAGVPAGATSSTLVVGNPGDSEALVSVEVAGRNGSFTPTDLEDLSVAPGAVETLDLTDVLPGDEAVALRVRAPVPVLASMRAVTRTDVAYADVATPLTGPAVAPALSGARTTLQLTAGAEPGAVTVEGFDEAGESTGSDDVALDATATATWRPARGTAYVVVTPTEGAVFGAAVHDQDAGLSTTTLEALTIRVRLPEVVPAPR